MAARNMLCVSYVLIKLKFFFWGYRDDSIDQVLAAQALEPELESTRIT